jgi:hypothetical protein
MPKQNNANAKRKGLRTQKRKHTIDTGFLSQCRGTDVSLNSRPPRVGLELSVNGTRPVSTGGSGVTWLEFFSGKRSTQRRNSSNTRRHSRKRASSNRR